MVGHPVITWRHAMYNEQKTSWDWGVVALSLSPLIFFPVSHLYWPWLRSNQVVSTLTIMCWVRSKFPFASFISTCPDDEDTMWSSCDYLALCLLKWANLLLSEGPSLHPLSLQLCIRLSANRPAGRRRKSTSSMTLCSAKNGMKSHVGSWSRSF